MNIICYVHVKMFCVILILIFSFQINILHGISLKHTYLNDVENKLERTIRQTNVAKCDVPSIPHGKIKILKQRSSTKKNSLSLNVTCDYSYVLQPPSDYLMSCVNGFWDVDDIPECIKCIKRPENNTDSELLCRESISENSIFTDCGQRLDTIHKPFVVNGTLSKFAEFPWHVGIYRKDPCDPVPQYHCGGSIITKKSILTVAHAFFDDYDCDLREYYIAAGKYHSNYFSDPRTAQKRKVIRKILHPRYRAEFTNFAWDIAVVIVDEPFEFSFLIHPVCIDWMSQFENEDLSPDKYGEVPGWGKTEKSFNTASSELRALKVPFVGAKECYSVVPNTFIKYLTHDKFCAGYMNGSSVCDGDSGGGLAFERQEDGLTKFYIRGLVSVGLQNDGRCDEYKYSTYTKISEYIPFIRISIQNENRSTPIKPTAPPRPTQPPEIFDIFGSVITECPNCPPCKTPNNRIEKCVPLYKCVQFETALENNPTIEVTKFINESQCDEKKVCCGSDVNYLSAKQYNPVTGRPINHKKIRLLPKQGVCGRSTTISQGQIYGETFAELLDLPWMALLEYGSPEQSAGFLCAGFLINEKYVLTTAHCALKKRSADFGQVFRVRFGEYNMSSEIDCVNLTTGNERNCADPPLNVDVEKITPHPLYDSKKKNNDIALLRLARKISYTDFIKPICLPRNKEMSRPGRQMFTANWDINTIDFSNPVKYKKIVTAVTDEDCIKKYAATGIQLINTHICAAGNDIENDECREDIGGPLMTTLSNSKDIYAEGVISYSFGRCGEFPIVATKVASFMDWILDTIEW